MILKIDDYTIETYDGGYQVNHVRDARKSKNPNIVQKNDKRTVVLGYYSTIEGSLKCVVRKMIDDECTEKGETVELQDLRQSIIDVMAKIDCIFNIDFSQHKTHICAAES